MLQQTISIFQTNYTLNKTGWVSTRKTEPQSVPFKSHFPGDGLLPQTHQADLRVGAMCEGHAAQPQLNVWEKRARAKRSPDPQHP